MSVTATAREPIVTVFLGAEVIQQINDVYYWFDMDDAGLTVEGPDILADFDDDGDVDQEDFGHLQICFTGPGIPQTDPVCRDARLDGDNDVDHDDFIVFRENMTGAMPQ